MSSVCVLAVALAAGSLAVAASGSSVLSRIQTGEADAADFAEAFPCAKQLGRDAEYVCDATTQVQAPAANCTQWRLATYLALADGNGSDCTKVGELIDELCQVQLTPFMVAELVPATCGFATNIMGQRCNDACLVSENFCSDYSDTSGSADTLQQCQSECGDYFGCRCYQIKGTANFQCYGETASVDGSASCYDLLPKQNPQIAAKCGSTSPCQPFFVCPTNLCLAFDVQCPAPSDCFDDPGVCDSSSGVCSFFEKPDGTACDDGLFYTSDDHCETGKCVGRANRCLQYGVTCTMEHNVCVQPGTCVPDSGDCRFPKTAPGTACDDGFALTKDDQCDGKGVCKGTPFDPCVDDPLFCQVPPDEPCILAAKCEAGTCTLTKENELKSCGDAKVCADGRCLALPLEAEFRLFGDGHCADEDELEINYYFNDVNTQQECATACLNDPLCIGYSFIPYTGRTCFIYAPQRTRSALSFWAWRGARLGVAIKSTKSLGAVVQRCYTRVVQKIIIDTSLGADKYLISPMGAVILIILVSGLWLVYYKFFFDSVNAFFYRLSLKIRASLNSKRD